MFLKEKKGNEDGNGWKEHRIHIIDQSGVKQKTKSCWMHTCASMNAFPTYTVSLESITTVSSQSMWQSTLLHFRFQLCVSHHVCEIITKPRVFNEYQKKYSHTKPLTFINHSSFLAQYTKTKQAKLCFHTQLQLH